MPQRITSLLDRCLTELDSALRTVAGQPRAVRPRPDTASAAPVGCSDKPLAAGLMRVNHAGEVAAQALYRGQAMVARDASLRAELLQAAAEEHDHLAWCRDRTHELGGRTSVLAPVWYAGSFALGALAGLAGDSTSLGFLAETEKQVAEHLDSHLAQLPADDIRSRELLTQMRNDEVAHGHKATSLGGGNLPKPAKQAMRLMSRVMTTTSRHI